VLWFYFLPFTPLVSCLPTARWLRTLFLTLSYFDLEWPNASDRPPSPLLHALYARALDLFCVLRLTLEPC
jgi:hypothetical protein